MLYIISLVDTALQMQVLDVVCSVGIILSGLAVDSCELQRSDVNSDGITYLWLALDTDTRTLNIDLNIRIVCVGSTNVIDAITIVGVING